MRELTAEEISSCFVNCSAKDLEKLELPQDLADRPWPTLDFLGWIDPSTPLRGYLVVDLPEGLTGVRLRFPGNPPSTRRPSMCSFCHTVHAVGGVALVSAPRRAGESAGSFGTYACADLACSLHVRDLTGPFHGVPARETIGYDHSVERLRTNVAAFVRRVMRG